jgi:hypothetical protein
MLKVRAIKAGYYGGSLRRPADEKGPASVFDLNKEEDFSPEWMERVGSRSADSEAPASKKSGKSTKITPAREAELAKIRKAVTNLDPECDEHWEKNGKASIDAVSDEAGFEVSQGDIDQALPNFTRDQARQGAASV